MHLNVCPTSPLNRFFDHFFVLHWDLVNLPHTYRHISQKIDVYSSECHHYPVKHYAQSTTSNVQTIDIIYNIRTKKSYMNAWIELWKSEERHEILFSIMQFLTLFRYIFSWNESHLVSLLEIYVLKEANQI